MKWLKIAGIGLIGVLVVYVVIGRDIANSGVAEEIRNNPEGERARRAMLLTLEDGRTYPVNYLHEGDIVYMGIDGLWWREFVDEAQPVEMLIRGRQLSGYAKTILDDPAYTKDVFSRLRPTVPKWLPDWLNGKLVEIRLRPNHAGERVTDSP